MPQPAKVEKAEIRELLEDGQPGSQRVQVQFNPETLKVSFANQVVPPDNNAQSGNAADQNGTTATQFVGTGPTKLRVRLWFDVTGAQPEGQSESDVRRLTQKVAYFITPKPSATDPNKLIPPGVRFVWGTFKFDGIMESLEESLEFFSAEGKPLRASLSFSLSQQEIQFAFNERPDAQPGGGKLPGVGAKPMTPAPAGSSLQGLAARAGLGGNWQAIAQANGIENPRLLQPGQLVDLNVKLR